MLSIQAAASPFVALAASPWLWGVWALAVGSFISMLVYRLPLMLDAWARGEEAELTLSSPASHCPACKKPLAWYRNIPLVGFLISRAWPCCAVKVKPGYLGLELCALAWGMLAWWAHPADPGAVWAWSFFGWALLAGAVMDYRTQWLPDAVTLSLLWVGLLTWALRGNHGTLSTHVVQVAAVYVGVTVFVWCYEKLRRLEQSLGGGDVKLLCAFAAWLDPLALAYILAVASTLQLVAMLALARKQAAFGPALAAAAAGTVAFSWVH